MPRKQSAGAAQQSLVAQVTEPADQPFVDVGRAIIKAGFLLANLPERPYFAYDLTVAQFDVLSALARTESGSLNCSEISEKTLITKGGITGILDRLEARGFVRRLHSREDRRSVLIQLTAKGAEFFRKVYPEILLQNRTLLEKALTRTQIRDLTELLDRMIHVLEEN